MGETERGKHPLWNIIGLRWMGDTWECVYPVDHRLDRTVLNELVAPVTFMLCYDLLEKAWNRIVIGSGKNVVGMTFC